MVGITAILMTARYEILRNSAIRNAAAPSTGGERMAPRPPAARSPPAALASEPARFSIGQATAPMVAVVATPEPEGPPRRNDARTTERPALEVFPPRSEKEKSR